jgi:N-acyl-D-aspartate/D-glutamate deacylase
LQPIDGYDATIVSGIVTQRGGQPTGARPGRLVRGVRPDPKAERHLDAAQ